MIKLCISQQRAHPCYTEFRIRDYLVTRPLPEKRAGLSLKQAILSLVSSS